MQALLDGVRASRAKPDQPPSFPGARQDPAEDAQNGPGARREEDDARQSRRKAMRILLSVVGTVVVLCGLIQAIPDPKPSLPEENGTRPAGSNDPAIVQAAISALDRCAKTVVLQPVNCPQEVGGWNDGAHDVKWLIHGNPAEGAIVRYNGVEGRFHVLGTAVMTASYQTPLGPELKLRVIQYWARVEWNAGKPVVAGIRKYDDSPRPPTPKSNPGIAGNELLYLVGTGFERCASAKRSPLPPECLPGTTLTSSDKAKWSLDGDPTINAVATFDDSTGLIHVVGDYSMKLAYSVFLLGPTSEPYSGRYDAVISVDAGQPKLLMIAPKD